MFCKRPQSLFKRQAQKIRTDISESNRSHQSETVAEDRYFGMPHSKLVALGRQSFDFLFQSCEKLRLVPFTRLSSGQYVKSNLKNESEKHVSHASLGYF